MATFRKRGSKWQAVVRRKGLPPLTKSFPTKANASLWARQIEHQADTGCLRDDPRILAQMTLGDLLRRAVRRCHQPALVAGPGPEVLAARHLRG